MKKKQYVGMVEITPEIREWLERAIPEGTKMLADDFEEKMRNRKLIKPKVRAPHIPNKVHKDKSKYTRKIKHKGKDEEGN